MCIFGKYDFFRKSIFLSEGVQGSYKRYEKIRWVSNIMFLLNYGVWNKILKNIQDFGKPPPEWPFGGGFTTQKVVNFGYVSG